MAGANRYLGTVARRLLSCLANSVPSERAFSAQNFIHNKTRNRLSQEKTDKLAFIYMNAKALRRDRKSFHSLTAQEIEDLEDEVFQSMDF